MGNEPQDAGPGGGTEPRLAELVAALSLAGDLGLGQPWEQGLRTCLLSLRLGEASGLGEEERRDLYYVALLRGAGCTADGHVAAAIFGDEIAFAERCSTLDLGRPYEVLSFMVRAVGEGLPATRRARMVANFLATGIGKMKGSVRAGCEVAQVVAGRLGLGAEVDRALGQVFERWDGKGWPRGTKGGDLSHLALIVALAQDVEVFHQAAGVDAAMTVARERAGQAYDPALVAHLSEIGPDVLPELDRASVWEDAIEAEPGARPRVSTEQLEEALGAFADFADLKSPSTLGHSRGVAQLAESAARGLGLPGDGVDLVRRAALAHDLGRAGIPAAIWEKPTRLTAGDWERVRLHPYLTERVLGRVPALEQIAAVGGRHHERLDGSGYHRGSPASQLSIAARLVAAADVYHALTEPRPHRAAWSTEAAAAELRAQARTGKVDADSANAILEAAGHRTRVRAALPAGLTPREVEVLGHLARGMSNRHIAGTLFVSLKTVDTHVQHIYPKLGVSTRAAAAMFAMKHGLPGATYE